MKNDGNFSKGRRKLKKHERKRYNRKKRRESKKPTIRCRARIGEEEKIVILEDTPGMPIAMLPIISIEDAPEEIKKGFFSKLASVFKKGK